MFERKKNSGYLLVIILLFEFIIKFCCVIEKSFLNGEASWVNHTWTTLPNLEECFLAVTNATKFHF